MARTALRSWVEAEKLCADEGLQLATPHSREDVKAPGLGTAAGGPGHGKKETKGHGKTEEVHERWLIFVLRCRKKLRDFLG